MIRFRQKMTVVYEVRYDRAELLDILGVDADPSGISDEQLANMILDKLDNDDDVIDSRLVEDSGDWIDGEVTEGWRIA